MARPALNRYLQGEEVAKEAAAGPAAPAPESLPASWPVRLPRPLVRCPVAAIGFGLAGYYFAKQTGFLAA